MYLKAVVAVRPFKNSKMYVSTNLEEVKDFNQISYFFLNTFVAHAQRTQGYLQAPEENKDNVHVLHLNLLTCLS